MMCFEGQEQIKNWRNWFKTYDFLTQLKITPIHSKKCYYGQIEFSRDTTRLGKLSLEPVQDFCYLLFICYLIFRLGS